MNERDEKNMKKILLVGNESNTLTETYNYLLKFFKVKTIGFDRIQIEKQLILHSAECILVNLKKATEEQLQILEWIKSDPQYSELKIIVIGFGYECNALSASMRLLVDKTLVYPMSKDGIVEEICELCGIGRLVARQRIKEEGITNEEKIKHVLVVDDDARMLRAVKNWLQDSYKVSIVNSGVAAMAFLKKQIPDVVLLDYEMPALSGAQTLELIRKEEQFKKLPVFFLTGVSDKEKVKDVVMLKPQGYILKGITREELIDQLNEFFMEN